MRREINNITEHEVKTKINEKWNSNLSGNENEESICVINKCSYSEFVTEDESENIKAEQQRWNHWSKKPRHSNTQQSKSHTNVRQRPAPKNSWQSLIKKLCKHITLYGKYC